MKVYTISGYGLSETLLVPSGHDVILPQGASLLAAEPATMVAPPLVFEQLEVATALVSGLSLRARGETNPLANAWIRFLDSLDGAETYDKLMRDFSQSEVWREYKAGIAQASQRRIFP